MKTIPALVAGTLFTISGAMAQVDETITARVVGEDEIPGVVMESVAVDYPDMDYTDWQTLSPEAYEADWVVMDDEGDTEEEVLEPEYYEVDYRGKGIHGYAVYNSEGELLHSKEVIKDEALPEAITQAIAKDYPNHKVMGDKEVIRDGNKNVKYYEVNVEKGKDKEKLYFDKGGKMVSKKEAERAG